MICAYWCTWNGNGSIVVSELILSIQSLIFFNFISYFDLIPWSSQVVPCVPSGGLVPLFPPVCPHGARCCPHPIIDHMAASTWHPSLVGCALHQDLKDYLNLSQSKNTPKYPLTWKVCTSTIFSSKKTFACDTFATQPRWSGGLETRESSLARLGLNRSIRTWSVHSAVNLLRHENCAVPKYLAPRHPQEHGQ